MKEKCIKTNKRLKLIGSIALGIAIAGVTTFIVTKIINKPQNEKTKK